MKIIRPQEGPQTEMLSCSADILVGGGSAGSGKSFFLLCDPLRYIRRYGFQALMFRQTYKQLRNPGGLWDTSDGIYANLLDTEGRPPLKRQGKFEWLWRSTKSSIGFSHLENESSKFGYDGSQIPYIGFDELQRLSESTFWYMSSRNRSTCGVRPCIRATCNPVPEDDPIGGWLNKLISWWVDRETGYPIQERSGVLRWFVRMAEGELEWADNPEVLTEKYASKGIVPKSITFIPAKLSDNKILEQANPEYRATLEALPPTERERLLRGNWHVRDVAGTVLNRVWFKPISREMLRPAVREVRYWDKAGTKDAGDRSAGVLFRLCDNGRWCITNCVSVRMASVEREQLIRQTAINDGPDVPIVIEQEPGSGGKESAEATIRNLYGFDVKAERPTGPKLARWRPLAAQAYAGNVDIVAGESWTEEFLNVLHNSDGKDGHRDDETDAAAGAFNFLALGHTTGVLPSPVGRASVNYYGSLFGR